MTSLGTRWTRVIVDWSKLQKSDPRASGLEGDAKYNAAYVKQLEYVTQNLHAAGINVILTLYLVPQWASNSKFWNSPPRGYSRGVYEPFYAMKTGDPSVMNAFQATCTYLTSKLGPGPYGVKHFECWNEPNLYQYLYPQTRPSNTNFASSTYLKMLRRFYLGVKAALPGKSSVVIGGATAPLGAAPRRGKRATSTSPQRFAKYLKKHGGAKWLDAYSHHPYYTGGSRSPAPNTPPRDVRTTVTLYNIGQLLKVFPKKPFYLTEFGYTTRSMPQWPVGVTPARQAKYLKIAYAMARKHRQIKVMLWFLVRDHVVSGRGARTQGWRRPTAPTSQAGTHSGASGKAW